MSINKIKIKIEKNLFSKNIIKSKKKRKGKKLFYEYTYNKDYLNKVRNLYELVERKNEEINNLYFEPDFID